MHYLATKAKKEHKLTCFGYCTLWLACCSTHCCQSHNGLKSFREIIIVSIVITRNSPRMQISLLQFFPRTKSRIKTLCTNIYSMILEELLLWHGIFIWECIRETKCGSSTIFKLFELTIWFAFSWFMSFILTVRAKQLKVQENYGQSGYSLSSFKCWLTTPSIKSVVVIWCKYVKFPWFSCRSLVLIVDFLVKLWSQIFRVMSQFVGNCMFCFLNQKLLLVI